MQDLLWEHNATACTPITFVEYLLKISMLLFIKLVKLLILFLSILLELQRVDGEIIQCDLANYWLYLFVFTTKRKQRKM